MKKISIFIVLAIMIISAFIIFKFNDGEKTIEKAISSSNPIKIIYEEKTDKGSIVFYTTKDWNDFSICFVRKTLNGYKYINGGTGDVRVSAKKIGFSYAYYPNIEKTPFPMYFGIIGNPEIKKIKVIEKKSNIEGEAKIINAKDKRIWLMYMNKFQGSDFEIVGLSAEGKELTRIKDNISPQYAEQKPLK